MAQMLSHMATHVWANQSWWNFVRQRRWRQQYAIRESTEGGILVWRKRSPLPMNESSEMRQQRFVGILNSLDIVSFLAKDWCLENQDKALKTPVSEVVVPNNSLLKWVDPGTRVIDSLELMKQGVRRLIVPTSIVWKGMSKRFSVIYHGKWLKNPEASSSTDEAFSVQKQLLVKIKQTRKPDMAGLAEFLKPLNEVISKANTLTEGRRTNFFNHLKTSADSLSVLAWIAYTGKDCG